MMVKSISIFSEIFIVEWILFRLEIHSNFCLYDDSVKSIPFSAMKTEYKREFCKTYLRSRSVPKTIGNLTKTTNELIDALRNDDTDVISVPEKS